MKKLVYLFCLIALISCKDDTKKEEITPVVQETEKTISLSNYSDENWEKGVGREYNMFIVDFTESNKELLKDVKVLELVDGTIVKVTGITISEPFIQINIEETAQKFKETASYPNLIFIKK